jgi:hypothetical protein
MPPNFFLGGFDGRVNLGLIRDVELEHQSLALGRQRFHLLRFARRHHRAKAALQRLGGQFAPEAGRTAGDKPNGFSLFALLLFLWS